MTQKPATREMASSIPTPASNPRSRIAMSFRQCAPYSSAPSPYPGLQGEGQEDGDGLNTQAVPARPAQRLRPCRRNTP